MADPDYKEAARKLWVLLDDIDTLDDACRADDAAFRKHTREVQRKRFAILSGERMDVLLAAGVEEVSRCHAALMGREKCTHFCGAAQCNAGVAACRWPDCDCHGPQGPGECRKRAAGVSGQGHQTFCTPDAPASKDGQP